MAIKGDVYVLTCYSLTHSLTIYSLTHSLTIYSLTIYSLTIYSLTIYSLTIYSLTLSLFTHSLTHSLTIYSLTYSLTHSLKESPRTFYLGSKIVSEDYENEGGSVQHSVSNAKSLKLGDVSDIRPGKVWASTNMLMGSH